MFLSLPSEDRLKASGAVGEKTAVKIYLAEKMLQLLDVLSGGGGVSIVAVCPAVGVEPAAKILWPKIYKVGTAKTHLSQLMARPLVAKQ
jgi:hypothetical protein